jgi:hypothetical protein
MDSFPAWMTVKSEEIRRFTKVGCRIVDRRIKLGELTFRNKLENDVGTASPRTPYDRLSPTESLCRFLAVAQADARLHFTMADS